LFVTGLVCVLVIFVVISKNVSICDRDCYPLACLDAAASWCTVSITWFGMGNLVHGFLNTLFLACKPRK